MMLVHHGGGEAADQVVENTGFELTFADPVGENPPPTAEELKVLREEVDKDKFYI